MKKTLIALMALAGLAAAETYTYTSETADKTNQGSYYGFTVALQDSDWMDSTIPTELTEVTLESITIQTRNDKSYSDTKIAVYAYTADSTTGTFVGLSDSNSFSTDTGVEFTFSDSITLNPASRYQFLFVTADSTSEGVDTFDEYKEKAMTWGIAVTNAHTNITSGWGTYTSSGINGWEGMYLPVVSFETSGSIPAVPEPATATLSLLALCGLAARRRRK